MLAIALVADFSAAEAGLQHAVDESWIPDLGVRFQLGIDGISVFLVLITALLWFGAVLFSALRDYPHDESADGSSRARFFYFLLAVGETAAIGAFVAQDLLLFVLFFDLMLIPFFFLIGTFGGEGRIAATTKMLVFTLVGSLLMLVAAIATAILVSQQTGNEISFSIEYLRENVLSSGSQEWLFCFFAAAFLVKMPAFPIHGWMPDAYSAAPLPVLALLSGVLSKVGAYGFLRVAFPVFPDATATFQEAILVIGVASILYGSVMAFTQNNVRLVAGYSSIAQLGFITVGMLSLEGEAANGAVLQMVNHALVTVAMFVVIADPLRAHEDRRPARDGRDGDARPDPRGALPRRHAGDAGDARIVELHRRVLHPQRALRGEDRVTRSSPRIGVALAAFYALRLYQRTMHNRLPRGHHVA